MSFGYKPVKDGIVAILNTLKPDVLKEVYTKEQKELTAFPCTTIEAKEDSADFHDTVSNLKVYQHFVRIYFRTDEKNDPDYEDVLETAVDAVKAALEHDITLGGICDWAMPTSGIWKGDPNTKNTPVRFYEMTVTTKARVVR